jgi:adenylylsulfate kinase-like enzyme
MKNHPLRQAGELVSKTISIPLVIISGLPASGKTTLARKLAPALGLSLFDKDDILEGLYEALGIGDADWRRRLSRASDEIFQRLAQRSCGAVLTSFWRNAGMPADSGTPAEWISSTSERLVEVHCLCDPEIAAMRFTKRIRHPGHLDSTRRGEDVLSQFQALAAMGPLGLGKLLTVDTAKEIDLSLVVDQVRILLNQG